MDRSPRTPGWSTVPGIGTGCNQGMRDWSTAPCRSTDRNDCTRDRIAPCIGTVRNPGNPSSGMGYMRTQSHRRGRDCNSRRKTRDSRRRNTVPGNRTGCSQGMSCSHRDPGKRTCRSQGTWPTSRGRSRTNLGLSAYPLECWSTVPEYWWRCPPACSSREPSCPWACRWGCWSRAPP